jgi:hypothetical protein
MKKSLLFIILILMQCACAMQQPVTASSHPLLSFEAISAEITVSHVETAAPDDLSQTLALNTEK